MSNNNLAISEVVKLCKRFEGFRSKPYFCPAGISTIGYGSTYYSNGNKVTLQDAPISEAEAEAMLVDQVVKIYLPGTLSVCPRLEGYKLAAIVDFSYNLGLTRLKGSTLRKKVNSEDWEGTCSELKKWTRGGGKILPGLVIRRQAEVNLILL